MTTILLANYMIFKRVPTVAVAIFFVAYLIIEGGFLLANLNKFLNGGWFTLVMASIFFVAMFTWYKGRQIKKRYESFVEIDDYVEIFNALTRDKSIEKYATNLVYITRADRKNNLEAKILYSIISKHPKKADNYWLLHINILDEPNVLEYTVETIIPNVLRRVEFNIGFKVAPKINLFFHDVIEELVDNKEFNIESGFTSLKKFHINGDFRFVLIDRVLTYDYKLSPFDKLIMNLYVNVKRIGIPDVKAYGLDESIVINEKVPLINSNDNSVRIKRAEKKTA